MSEMSFEELLDESFKTIHTGDIITGKVIEVKPDRVILNIGYKSEGIISRNDYSADSSLDLTTVLNVGDDLEVKVRKINDGEGQIILSHRDVVTERNNQKIQKAFEDKEILSGRVEKAVNGGLSVMHEGIRLFVPASLVSDKYEKDLTKYIGQDIQFVIIEFNPQKHRIIGDRKQLVLAEHAAARKALLEKLNPGDVIDGTVKNVTDFGAFVDLGGIDGLLHISEMSWGRTESPKKTYKSGDPLRVMIKGISEEGKVSLTRKFPDENPWVLALTKYAPGTIVEGKVARLADFGAFVNLEPGIDALLHVSQIALERIDKPSDVLKVGDTIRAKVTDMDAEARRISLSIKALLNDNNKKKRESEAESGDDVIDVYTDSQGDAKGDENMNINKIPSGRIPWTDKAEELKDKAKETIESAPEKIDELKDKASEVIDNAPEKFDELKDRAKVLIDEALGKLHSPEKSVDKGTEAEDSTGKNARTISETSDSASVPEEATGVAFKTSDEVKPS